jgi:hypothetical protein
MQESAQDAIYLGSRPTGNKVYGSRADQVRIGELTPGRGDKGRRITRDSVRDAVLHDLLMYDVPWLRARVRN